MESNKGSIWVGSSLACKYLTRMEVTDSDQRVFYPKTKCVTDYDSPAGNVPSTLIVHFTMPER
jgi:hypothetical protein